MQTEVLKGARDFWTKDFVSLKDSNLVLANQELTELAELTELTELSSVLEGKIEQKAESFVTEGELTFSWPDE